MAISFKIDYDSLHGYLGRGEGRYSEVKVSIDVSRETCGVEEL